MSADCHTNMSKCPPATVTKHKPALDSFAFAALSHVQPLAPVPAPCLLSGYECDLNECTNINNTIQTSWYMLLTPWSEQAKTTHKQSAAPLHPTATQAGTVDIDCPPPRADVVYTIYNADRELDRLLSLTFELHPFTLLLEFSSTNAVRKKPWSKIQRI